MKYEILRSNVELLNQMVDLHLDLTHETQEVVPFVYVLSLKLVVVPFLPNFTPFSSSMLPSYSLSEAPRQTTIFLCLFLSSSGRFATLFRDSDGESLSIIIITKEPLKQKGK